MKDHVYTPLSDQTNSFRVLAILPAWKRNARLNCELVEADLDNLDAAVFHFYEALSYTWGDVSDKEDITLDDRSFAVTKSLAAALRQLRAYKPKSDGIMFIWVDAICINQGDVSERNAQVSKMGIIYSRAVQVVVWLGPAMDDSDLAMKTIDKITNIGTAEDWLVQSLQDPSDLRSWKAVARLFLRPYWWRLWIRQEVILAKEVIVTCGSGRIGWEAFTIACDLLSREEDLFQWISVEVNSRNESALKQVVALDDLQTSFHQHGALDLERMLLHAKGCNCTDPRDRVFAALGLVGEQARGIRLDYTLAFQQISIEAVKTSILTSGSLEILTACQDTSATSGLPSWTPDIQEDWIAIPIRCMEGTEALYSTAASIDPSYSFSGKTLTVRGIVVDPVSEAGPDCLDMNHLYHTVAAWKQLARRHLFDTSHLDDIFWRTLIADQDMNGNRAEPEMVYDTGTLTGVKLSFSATQSIPDLDVEGWYTDRDYSLFAGRVDIFARRRRLFATASGRIGLGMSVRRGDLVCVVYGVGVPLILRSVDDKYLVVGEAYVHGIMDGEIVGQAGSAPLASQDFCLI